jgi:hypothetical protein
VIRTKISLFRSGEICGADRNYNVPMLQDTDFAGLPSANESDDAVAQQAHPELERNDF